jgi:hypothetical protein
MYKAARFFIFCSGTDQSILEQCPTDRNKYMGIGATVFFTGVLAFFSSGYALYTVFDSWLAAVSFGLVWGLMIFNLDRYIVMSMKNNGKWYRDLIIALPRVGLAVLLALVISKPLEMKIFEKEINTEIAQMEQEVYKKQEDKVTARFEMQLITYTAEIAQLKQEIADKTAARDTLAARAVQEADGTGGSGQRNLGPIYKAKKEEADKAVLELQQTQAANLPAIAEKELAIKSINSTVQGEITGLERSRFNGLAARMEALSRLSASSEAILLAVWFITLLFVAIETAPILVKLISYRSPYDYLLHNHEHIYEMTHKEQVTQRQNATLNKLKADSEIGVHRVNADIQAEKAAIDQALQEKLEGLIWNKGKWSGA